MVNGTLKEYLSRREITTQQCLSISLKVGFDVTLSKYQIKCFCNLFFSEIFLQIEITCAMEYLERMKLVHRSLSSKTIFVGETIDIIKVSVIIKFYITSRKGKKIHREELENYIRIS